MQHEFNRREIILSAGGLVVTGGSFLSADVYAQDTVVGNAKDLIFRTTNPRNGEPELPKLVANWITPTSLFYVRSHAPNPVIDPDTFRLKVEGMVRNPIEIGLKELAAMSQSTTTATLTCAGNRRAEYNETAKVGGVQWGPGAIGNATWSGVALATVLKKAGVLEGAKHVWFDGLDEIPKGDKVIPFGGSIPMEKAMISDGPGAPLLATKMNGQALSPDHGYPLRTVVPGYIGARSVKWLGKVVVSDRPSPNHYVATAYKVVRDTSPLDWSESGPIYRYPINAAIATPQADTRIKAGEIELTGYVLPSGRPESKINRVAVSGDGGKTWARATLTGQDSEFCWQLWKAKVKVSSDTKQLVVRAGDTQGGFMPPRVPWNAKGYLQNSWYRLPVTVD